MGTAAEVQTGIFTQTPAPAKTRQSGGLTRSFCFQCVRGGGGRSPSSLQGGLPNSRPPGDDDDGLDPEPEQPDPPAARLLRCEH